MTDDSDYFKRQFLLNPEVTFLNHGSFGAAPRPVFDVYQDWQRQLEWEPIQFIDRDLPGHLAAARQALSDYLRAPADDLVYVPNATMGVNIVARSLDLGPGDEVLTSDHEYGACDNIWCFLSQKKGFSYRPQPIALPMTSPETIVEQFWSGVTPRTRVIYLSHITSATAQTLPVAAICARARQAGILTIVDGAHAPGQIPLDLAQIGADFYTGNCHKWLCSPKGAGFLYARPPAQSLVEPLVVGWGWGPERTFSFGSDFLDYLQWLGTNDLSAYLAVPAAIQFQADHDWPAVRQRCRQLLTQALERLQDLTGLPPAYRQELCLEPGASSYQQMGIAPLPLVGDVTALRLRLYQEYRIEVPCLQWRDRQFIRISIQAYNSQADVDRLLVALRQVLPMGAETYS